GVERPAQGRPRRRDLEQRAVAEARVPAELKISRAGRYRGSGRALRVRGADADDAGQAQALEAAQLDDADAVQAGAVLERGGRDAHVAFELLERDLRRLVEERRRDRAEARRAR